MKLIDIRLCRRHRFVAPKANHRDSIGLVCSNGNVLLKRNEFQHLRLVARVRDEPRFPYICTCQLRKSSALVSGAAVRRSIHSHVLRRRHVSAADVSCHPIQRKRAAVETHGRPVVIEYPRYMLMQT